MDTIFTLADEDELMSEKVNLDDLYEKKREIDLSKLSIYKRILSRIHNKIKITSRQSIEEQFCWFLIPEVMIGIPNYDQGACIAYIVDQLTNNGFGIRYTHPNLLFISWKHWVPSYVRNEIKKKTGVTVDGFGNNIETNTPLSGTHAIVAAGATARAGVGAGGIGIGSNSNADNMIFANKGNTKVVKTNKEYKSIDTYRPTGALVYNKELIKKIEDKI